MINRDQCTAQDKIHLFGIRWLFRPLRMATRNHRGYRQHKEKTQ